MRWTGEAVNERGVAERLFTLECEGRTVPGVLWTPAGAAGPRPLVLIGHGGGMHKRAQYVTALARRLVRHRGMAAAAIDGPDHGDRREDKGLDFDKVWAERLQRRLQRPQFEEMVADWKATLDALQELPEVGAGSIGYWGLSMGTIYGLPFVAAEPRVTVAVLGLMGVDTAPGVDEGAEGRRARLSADAARVTVPLLFLAQWDDELVPRANALALFDAIASKDKRLHVNPGAHQAVTVEEFDHSEAFFARHLQPPQPPK